MRSEAECDGAVGCETSAEIGAVSSAGSQPD